MSLTSALNSAVSGLKMTSRATELVSENVANASTPGYARRSLAVSSLVTGGRGVRITGVQRHVDPALQANRRQADAEQGHARTIADFHARLSSFVGEPGNSASLMGRLAAFESSLISAASRPDSAQRLDAVARTAGDLVSGLNRASQEVSQMRSDADRSLNAQVNRLNGALAEVERLNTRIRSAASSGGPAEGLMDQRQLLVDEINRIMPVNVIARDSDQIALYTNGGAALLDGSAAEVSFAPVNLVTPEMTQTSGALSGLEINGFSIPSDAQSAHLRGGSLAAEFRIRDELGPEALAQLDQVAADLIQRYETAGLDPTVGAGDPGLFTDDGAPFDPAAAPGLAGRLSVNTAVDPEQGGASWRLRDGLGATAPGPQGESRLLKDFGTALETQRAQGSDVLTTGDVSASALAVALTSATAQRQDSADQALSWAANSYNELVRAEAATGVDTDQELQSLLVFELAYGANARVIEVVDDMMQRLLRI